VIATVATNKIVKMLQTYLITMLLCYYLKKMENFFYRKADISFIKLCNNQIYHLFSLLLCFLLIFKLCLNISKATDEVTLQVISLSKGLFLFKKNSVF